MSHTPHELTEEFPGLAQKIQDLSASNAHFAKLSERYHTLNREIHRGETDVEPMDDMHLEELKKERLALLDEISSHLK